jgi:peroxiredoxin
MEVQETPSVLLPGLYLEELRSPLKPGTRAPQLSLGRCEWSVGSGNVRLPRGTRTSNGTLVVFWAFWCDTWKDMTRDLNLLRPQLAAMKLQVLAVSVDASQQPVARRSFESGRIWWPVGIDADKSVTERWGVRRVPTIFVLDRSNTIRRVYEGFPGKQTFVRDVANSFNLKAPSVAKARRK